MMHESGVVAIFRGEGTAIKVDKLWRIDWMEDTYTRMKACAMEQAFLLFGWSFLISSRCMDATQF